MILRPRLLFSRKHSARLGSAPAKAVSILANNYSMLGQLFLTIAVLALFHCKDKRQFSCRTRRLHHISQRPSQPMNVCIRSSKYVTSSPSCITLYVQIFLTGRHCANLKSLFLHLYVCFSGSCRQNFGMAAHDADSSFHRARSSSSLSSRFSSESLAPA